MSEYRANDQERWLGQPPWKPDDPALIAWEKAHGHDVRLDCDPYVGCHVELDRLAAVEQALRELALAADRLSVNYGGLGGPEASAFYAAIDRARALLEGSEQR